MNSTGHVNAARASHPRRHSRSRTLAYGAFLIHRVSGLLLALFLPVHFFLLAQSLRGAAALDQALTLTDMPIVKFAEWGLVMLLTLHLVGGVRLILIEFGPWRGVRSGWITATVVISGVTGLLFLYSVVS
ncbi:MAG: succinate dehydrogenase, cytochrome b556 subunit [Burkholderiaceae bacterium]|jgi:fumarate reductase subunit D